MSWLQLKAETDAGQAERLEQLMEENGALSVTLVDAADQPLYEPAPGETPLWGKVLVTGLWPGDNEARPLIDALTAGFQPDPLPPVQVDILEEQDWQRAWIEDFQPIRFGRRLWICPSWSEPPDPEGVIVKLDPGLAFGTGTHPTTDLCLQWLDAHPPRGQVLVDYGCGSGVLGIAALLLGAERVLGVDNDPQALLATRDNCAKNAIDEARFPVWLPDDFAAETAADGFNHVDGVLANILAEPLMELAGELAGLVRPGGWLLLSGILEKQARQVADAYAPWFEMREPRVLDGWVRLEGVRRKS